MNKPGTARVFTLLSLAVATVSPQPAMSYDVEVIPVSVYNDAPSIEAFDVIAGVSGFAIEDFEDEGLILSYALGGGQGMSVLPRLFNRSEMGFNGGQFWLDDPWDGDHVLSNYIGNDGTEQGGLDVEELRLIFNGGPGVVGIGLSNLQSNANLQVNGVTIESLFQLPLQSGLGRNGYIKITAQSGDAPILSVGFVDGTLATGDSITVDHVAFGAASAPTESPMRTNNSSEVPTNTEQKYGECSVLPHNGENRLDRIDLAVPGRGDIHFQFNRRYRSRIRYDGPIGHNWDFSYNERLAIQPSGDVLRQDKGRTDIWTINPDDSYTSARGFFGSLIKQPDDTFVIREPNGFKRMYDANGVLTEYRDRHGNQMLFEYDGDGNLDRVIDAYGRLFDFTFADDRLASIVDFTGRAVVYGYDTNGDLVSVRTPVVTGTSTGNDFPAGRTESYTYSSGFTNLDLNHNLLSVTRSQEVADGGNPYYTWTYGEDPADPLNFDRALTQNMGGTNASGVAAGGAYTFFYEELNTEAPPGDATIERLKATVTDRAGNIEETFYNEFTQRIRKRELTRGLRLGEPTAYETSWVFNDDDLLISRILPEGNEIQYVYQSGGSRGSQRNVIEMRLVADPGRGGGEDLVTTYSYDPLFNQPLSATGPRGNATGFTPPIGTASAARYTTNTFIDYQESNDPIQDAVDFGIDLSSVSRGLGDLNGDGLTNQTAGNIVRIAAPTVQLLPGSNEAGNFGATSQPVITEMQWNDSGQLLATIDAEGNVVANSYYPANDPDGDGVPSVTPLGDPGTAATGYVETSTRDAANSPRRTSPVPPVQLETHFSYDAVGNIIATRNPRGVVTTVEVNQLNEPVVITRGADVTEAAASGQLITGEAPFAYQLRNTYDYNGRVILREIENRDGNTAGVGGFVGYGFTYDILNRLVTRTVEIDSDTTLVTQYRYDANENLVSVTQPEGNETRSVYDERDLLFTATRGFGSPDTSTTQRDYDLNGNPERFIDAADNDGDSDPEQTITAYDGFDRVIQVTDALGNFIQTSYDPASNAVQQQVFGHPPDSPGSAPTPLRDTRTAHDELNRVFQTDQALFLAAGYTTLNPVNLLDDNSDGFVTDRFEYDALSRPTFRVEDDGEVTQTVYDGASRMISTIDALGNRTDMQYDQNSNVVLSSSVELSPEALVPDETFTTRNVYDQLDRLVRTTDNIGQTSYYSYDSRDNLIDSRDAQAATLPDPLGVFPGDINVPGNSTTYVYDGLDRRIQAIYDLRVGGSGDGALDTSNPANPDGQVTRGYTYDGNSRLTGMSDDKGNTTSFGYDALDRRISQANADLTAHAYSYDGDDNLVQSVDPNASVVINTYDAINRLVQVDITRGSGVAGTTRQTYSYDGLSRLTASSDDNGDAGTLLQQTELVYDSLSRVLEERQNGKPVSRTFSGDGDKLSCTYPGGRTLTHTYDAIDRVKLTSDGGGLITDSNWIGPGYRELRRLAGNGTSLSYLDETDSIDVGYDGIKRVVAQQCLLADGTTAFMDRGYDYNRANQRLSEHRFDDGNLSDEYVYDSLYRITTTRLDQAGVRGPGATRGVDEITYQLDGVGNRTEVIATVDPTIVDIDGDGLVGAADNCLEVANPDQRDTDSDGYGNLCDGDVDNSGAVDLQDLAIFRIFFLSPGDLDTDLNGDGSTDLLDLAILRALFLKAPGPSGAAGPGIAGPLVDSYTSNEMNEYDEITGATRTHDENGNLLTDGTRTFSYDYRDRLVSVSDGSRGPLSNYLYYADNRRAAKDAGGATTSYYYYGWQPVEERNAADQTIITYVWGPGDIDELVQFERSTIHPLGAGTFFAHQNVRSDVVSLTDAAGNLAETYRYDDFGNVEAPSALGNEFLFQGRRFDADTGLYYFRNRYHDPVTGRFLQRDPVSSDLDLGNRYAFVANQPASLRDPLGLDPEFYDPDRELTSRYADFALSEAGDEATEKALTKVGESLGQAIGRKVKKKIQGKIIGGAATGGLYAIYDFVNDAAEASKQYRELAVSTYYDYISASDPEWEQRAKEERARYDAEIERWQDCLEEKRLKEADEKFSEMMALTVRSYQQENAPPTPRSPEPDNPLPENDQSPDLDEELRKRMSGSSRKGKSLAERLRGVESHAVE